jgi:hypothetical protein
MMIHKIKDLHGFPEFVNYQGHRFNFRWQGASSKKKDALDLVRVIKARDNAAIIRVFQIDHSKWYAVYWREK